MSKISIELDLDVVQEAIHAKVQPAVDDILSRYDIPKLIKDELLKEKEPDNDMYVSMYYMMRGASAGKGRPLLEQLIETSVRELAEQYIKGWVEKERPRIEDAFETMLRDSTAPLAKKMYSTLSDALGDKWQFELETTLSPKEPDRDDY